MKELFRETVHNWEDWGRVYQSIPAFAPLAEEICRREGLPIAPLENLTPGTNAVFRMGGLVMKIYFPRESGLDPYPDFHNEAAVCGFLSRQGVPAPKLLAAGKLADKYDFYYIVMEFIEGREAGDWLAEAPKAEKLDFARRLKELLGRMNLPADGLIPPLDVRELALENPRLTNIPPSLAEELRQRARQAELSRPVLVHGDLTGENLLVRPGGEVTVIDCADARLAPAWYEYGPIVFELFRCDPALTAAFAAGQERSEFIGKTLDALSIHDFGPDLLREAARRLGRPAFQSLCEVERLLWEITE